MVVLWVQRDYTWRISPCCVTLLLYYEFSVNPHDVSTHVLLGCIGAHWSALAMELLQSCSHWYSRSIASALHHNDVRMGAMASQITSLAIVYSTVFSADQRKHQISASLAFVKGIHRWPVNSPHKWSVTRKMFPFDDVIMLANHTWMIREELTST